MTGPEFSYGPEAATQEDVSYAMQAVEDSLTKYGWPTLPEGERVVDEMPVVADELPRGHAVHMARIPGARLESLFLTFVLKWEVGEEGVEIRWQDEHSKMMLRDGFAEPVRVPASAQFLIHKADASEYEEEAVIMERTMGEDETEFSVARIFMQDEGIDTSIMPGDTPTEPETLWPVSSQEVQELEAIVHALPLLLRPNS